MKIQREYIFDEQDVFNWCQQAGDWNDLHHSEKAATEHELFDGRIVPGVQLLSKVSGLIPEWAYEKDGQPIILGIDAVRFKEPVYFGERVAIELRASEVDGDRYILSFDVKRGSTVCVDGFINTLIR